MIHTFKEDQHNLYKFNDIINIKLNLILEHLKINVPVPAKQPQLFNLGLPIP